MYMCAYRNLSLWCFRGKLQRNKEKDNAVCQHCLYNMLLTYLGYDARGWTFTQWVNSVESLSGKVIGLFHEAFWLVSIHTFHSHMSHPTVTLTCRLEGIRKLENTKGIAYIAMIDSKYLVLTWVTHQWRKRGHTKGCESHLIVACFLLISDLPTCYKEQYYIILVRDTAVCHPRVCKRLAPAPGSWMHRSRFNREKEVCLYLKAAYKQVPQLLEQCSWFTHYVPHTWKIVQPSLVVIPTNFLPYSISNFQHFHILFCHMSDANDLSPQSD